MANTEFWNSYTHLELAKRWRSDHGRSMAKCGNCGSEMEMGDESMLKFEDPVKKYCKRRPGSALGPSHSLVRLGIVASKSSKQLRWL